MQDEAKIIRQIISENFECEQTELEGLDQILESRINHKRARAIIELAIKNKLDKKTIIAFLVYQLFKVDQDLSNRLAEGLDKDIQTMVADYKTIQDINTLTASEEVEDLKRMFLVMSKDLRVVIMKLFGVYYDISILNLQTLEHV